MPKTFYFTYDTGLREARSTEELDYWTQLQIQRGGERFDCETLQELFSRIETTEHTVFIVTFTTDASHTIDSLRKLPKNAEGFITDHIQHMGCPPMEITVVSSELAENDVCVDINCLLLVLSRQLQSKLSQYIEQEASNAA